MRRRRLPELALLAAGCVYGASFLATQEGVKDLDPFAFAVLRYAVALVIIVPMLVRIGWRTSGPEPHSVTGPHRLRNTILAGTALGALAFVGYVAQFIGLRHTSTSNSAFITGLCAAVVPIVEVFVYRKRPSSLVLGAVGLAMVGLFFLTGASGEVGFGDLVTLITTVTFGIWLVFAGLWARRYPMYGLLAAGWFAIAIVGIPVSFVTGFGRFTPMAVAMVVVLGLSWVVSDALTMWGQARVEATRGGLLLLTEPIVAAAIGYGVGERIGITGLIGAALMLLAIVMVELRPGNADNPVVEADPGLEVTD